MTIPLDAPSLRERIFAQEPRLLDAARRVAEAVHALPTDSRFPTTHRRTLIVGGFVRDALLGAHPKDIDVEIFGVAPEILESLIQRLYPGLVSTVGRSFGILKIHLGHDVEFDISIPRRESKTGRGHTAFAIEGDPTMSFSDAARRRDFTINAIAADALSGEVLDAYDGVSDLAARRLRVTDPERFQDDPLRVYRAIQFAARMDLTVESQSLELMREMVARGDLDQLSRERITDEWKKLLLKAERPSVGFTLARQLGIISRDYPELHALIGCPQEPEWHPEGDVWTHTMMVVDFAAKHVHQVERHLSPEQQLDAVFGALCHDLGKPPTTKFEDGRIRSRGHEAAGEKPTRALSQRLTFSERTVESAVAIATQHLKPWILFRDLELGHMTHDAYVNNVRKLLKRIYPLSAETFLAATEADFRGRGVAGVDTAPYRHGELMRQTITKYHLDEEPTKTLLQGRDLLELGVQPGTQMGELIQLAESLRDEGKITTRDEALDAVRAHLGR